MTLICSNYLPILRLHCYSWHRPFNFFLYRTEKDEPCFQLHFTISLRLSDLLQPLTAFCCTSYKDQVMHFIKLVYLSNPDSEDDWSWCTEYSVLLEPLAPDVACTSPFLPPPRRAAPLVPPPFFIIPWRTP